MALALLGRHIRHCADRAAAGIEVKDIRIDCALDQALVIRGRIVRVILRCGGADVACCIADESRSARERIGVVIRAHGKVTGEDAGIVLGVAGIRVLAPAPLGNVAVVTGTHERAPGYGAATMSAIVGTAARCVMRQ